MEGENSGDAAGIKASGRGAVSALGSTMTAARALAMGRLSSAAAQAAPPIRLNPRAVHPVKTRYRM